VIGEEMESMLAAMEQRVTEALAPLQQNRVLLDAQLSELADVKEQAAIVKELLEQEVSVHN
jgi:hypothetical protein